MLSTLHVAQKRVTVSCQSHHTAKQLKEGERTRFELGETSLLFVILREVVTGDALLESAQAASSLLKTLAEYYQATLAASLVVVEGEHR